MEEMDNTLEWVFISKCKIPEDIVDILAPGEVWELRIAVGRGQA